MSFPSPTPLIYFCLILVSVIPNPQDGSSEPNAYIKTSPTRLMHSRGHKGTSVHPSCPRASDNKILGAEIINANMRSKSQPYGTEFTIHIHMFFRRSARRARLLSTRKLRTPAPAHHTLRRARRLCCRKAAGTAAPARHITAIRLCHHHFCIERGALSSIRR